MTYTIQLIEDQKAVMIINRKGDHITLDFLEEENFRMIQSFVEDTDK